MVTGQDVSRPVRSQDYRDLDRSPAADDAIAHMDEVGKDPFIARLKTTSYELLGAAPGMRMLDVGCGAGRDVLALAMLVAPGGQAVGLDLSETMVSEARLRTTQTASNARFLAGDASNLPFPDAHFDGVRAERLLQHVEDPVAVLSEMVRVTRPAGRILVIDADRGVFAQDFDGWDIDVAFRLGRWAAESGPVRNGLFSRQARRHMLRMGLVDVVAHPFVNASAAELERRSHVVDRYHEEALVAGVITPEEAARRTAAVHAAIADGTFHTTTLFWATVGTRPA